MAVGILGAVIMPHNIYLHSALVQSRCSAGRSTMRSHLTDAALNASALLLRLHNEVACRAALESHRTSLTARRMRVLKSHTVSLLNRPGLG